MEKFDNIPDYIATFSPEIQDRLQQVRATIQKIAPDATEAIKYAIPTFVLHGNLVHFAAFKQHIGFYPAPTGIKAFEKDLAPYKQGKGSIRFPYNEPLPLKLIEKIVAFRVKENLKKK